MAEALAHQGRTAPADPGLVVGGERGRLEHDFLAWLEAGGFPEAQGLDAAARRQLLRDYCERGHPARRGRTARGELPRSAALAGAASLGERLQSLQCREVPHRGLKGQGIAVSRDTLHHFLGYLEDRFLVRTVWREADSERQRTVNPRKIYPVDPGLIPLFDRTGRANVGHALETAVLIELERRRCEVTYVRVPEAQEVSFLARGPDGSEHWIQVSADATEPETATRELRALRKAGRHRPKAQRGLLTLTRDRTPPAPPEDVTCWPAYQWMLTNGGTAARGREE